MNVKCSLACAQMANVEIQLEASNVDVTMDLHLIWKREIVQVNLRWDYIALSVKTLLLLSLDPHCWSCAEIL